MASLKKAIEQKCKDCTYDQSAAGTWREQTERCTVRSCALWEVRPISVNGKLAKKGVMIVDGFNIDKALETLEANK